MLLAQASEDEMRWAAMGLANEDGAAANLAPKGAAANYGRADRLAFPFPGKLDGVQSLTKAVLEVKNIHFKYTEDGPMILNGVTARASLSSRVALIGRNGAGKSTLMGIMCGDLFPVEVDGVVGDLKKHKTLRMAYIAQQHAMHLNEFLDCSPYTYIQRRYMEGWDNLRQRLLKTPANDEDKAYRAAQAKKLGKYGYEVQELMSRHKKGKEFYYECQFLN